ncbi:hypothetical protein KQX63_07090 [Rhodopseudomonas palustris]|uniref:Uncharacterized protein n=1 Tax=Rhodopseudomonas palustris TaxID=1076 RepID=A0AAX3E2K5_RHOPL|nr:hypothetical protein [Rhodopseudomonas palustris]UYO41050.1 hypothetical protein KQX62_07030 [Rhodopseudomonas palustris]UYO45774.1 hypothetical protein KQX63_07090 [Rhodopseudomonas palustris]UYO55240.1 hypothetical protein KQX61_07495 [Rhodopseudomonas palustris]
MNANISIIADLTAPQFGTPLALITAVSASRGVISSGHALSRSGLCCSCRMNLG